MKASTVKFSQLKTPWQFPHKLHSLSAPCNQVLLLSVIVCKQAFIHFNEWQPTRIARGEVARFVSDCNTSMLKRLSEITYGRNKWNISWNRPINIFCWLPIPQSTMTNFPFLWCFASRWLLQNREIWCYRPFERPLIPCCYGLFHNHSVYLFPDGILAIWIRVL